MYHCQEIMDIVLVAAVAPVETVLYGSRSQFVTPAPGLRLSFSR